MVRAGRNQRCPCGSGRKVKHCCGQAKGPSEAELAKAALVAEANRAVQRLAGLDEEEFHQLYRQMLDLPTTDHSMLIRVPRLVTPEIERLRHAIEIDDVDGIDSCRAGATARCDSPLARKALLDAARRLGDQGCISEELVALVAMDLARPDSALVQSSLVEAIAVDAGAVHTPSGLIVVAR